MLSHCTEEVATFLWTSSIDKGNEYFNNFFYLSRWFCLAKVCNDTSIGQKREMRISI